MGQLDLHYVNNIAKVTGGKSIGNAYKRPLPSRHELYCAIQASNDEEKIIANYETWCSECDKCTIFVPPGTELPKAKALGAHIVQLKTVENPKEEKRHLGIKQRKMFEFMDEGILNCGPKCQHPRYRWYLLADDDSFVYVRRMRRWLNENYHPDIKHWLGRRCVSIDNNVFQP